MMFISERKSGAAPGRSEKNGTAPDASADGTPIRNVAIAVAATALPRDHPHSSITYDTGTSSKAIVDVRAAIARSRKKAVPNSQPAGNSANRVGRTWNTRPGPDEGLSPAWKSAGKMMRPASSAMRVSKRQMIPVEVTRLIFFET